MGLDRAAKTAEGKGNLRREVLQILRGPAGSG
jgi:hypothetical protein